MITNGAGAILSYHSVKVTLQSTDLQGFVDFERVRFYSAGVELDRWLKQTTGATATY